MESSHEVRISWMLNEVMTMGDEKRFKLFSDSHLRTFCYDNWHRPWPSWSGHWTMFSERRLKMRFLFWWPWSLNLTFKVVWDYYDNGLSRYVTVDSLTSEHVPAQLVAYCRNFILSPSERFSIVQPDFPATKLTISPEYLYHNISSQH